MLIARMLIARTLNPPESDASQRGKRRRRRRRAAQPDALLRRRDVPDHLVGKRHAAMPPMPQIRPLERFSLR